jgi:hypothetical protein
VLILPIQPIEVLSKGLRNESQHNPDEVDHPVNMPVRGIRGFQWPPPSSTAAEPPITLMLTPLTTTVLSYLAEHRRECPICTIELAPNDFVAIFSCCNTAAHVTCVSAYLNTPPPGRVRKGRDECMWCRTQITAGRRLNRVINPISCQAWKEQENFAVPEGLQVMTWPQEIDISPRVIGPRPRAVHHAPPARNTPVSNHDRLTRIASILAPQPDQARAAWLRVRFPPTHDQTSREELDAMTAELAAHEAEMAAATARRLDIDTATIEEALLTSPWLREDAIEAGLIPPDPVQRANDVPEQSEQTMSGGPLQEPVNQENLAVQQRPETPIRPEWFEQTDRLQHEGEGQQNFMWDHETLHIDYPVPGVGARGDDDLDSLTVEVGGPVRPPLLAGPLQEITERYAHFLDG